MPEVRFRVKGVCPDEIDSPRDFTVLGDRLLFTTSGGRFLWESDGTPAGTFRVKPLVLRSLTFPAAELVRAGNRVFFAAHDGLTGVELWAVEERLGASTAVAERRLVQ